MTTPLRHRAMTATAKKRRRIINDIEAIIYGLAFLFGGTALSTFGELLCRWAGVG